MPEGLRRAVKGVWSIPTICTMPNGSQKLMDNVQNITRVDAVDATNSNSLATV